MPRPKKSSQEVQIFGSRKSEKKEDFLGIKKAEEKVVEKIGDTIKKTGVKVLKEVEKTIEKEEEFPEFDVGIDIFEPQNKDEEKIQEKIVKKTKKGETLIPLEDYIKAGCYIGTKVITPHMRKYVYRRRNDGIAIINTNIIDEKLKEAAEFVNKYEPEDFIVVCKREAGWRAVKLFAKLTGVKVFTKKYPAGILTNTRLPSFFETELVVICDPWLDKNALRDAKNVKKKVLSLCDTNNLTNGVDVVVPINNKSNKSLGVVFYVLAREYVKAKKLNVKVPEMEEFIGEKLQELQVKKDKKKDADLEKDKARIESIRELNKDEE